MAEPKTLDNPNDAAIREQQRQQRIEQGKRLAEEAKKPFPPVEFYDPFIFRFRKIKTHPSFGGLWELAVLKKDGKVDEIVSDANDLPSCLDAIGNIFANKGY